MVLLKIYSEVKDAIHPWLENPKAACNALFNPLKPTTPTPQAVKLLEDLALLYLGRTPEHDRFLTQGRIEGWSFLQACGPGAAGKRYMPTTDLGELARRLALSVHEAMQFNIEIGTRAHLVSETAIPFRAALVAELARATRSSGGAGGEGGKEGGDKQEVEKVGVGEDAAAGEAATKPRLTRKGERNLLKTNSNVRASIVPFHSPAVDMLPFRLLELLQSLILDGKSREKALKLTLDRRQSGDMSTLPPSKSIQVLGQRLEQVLSDAVRPGVPSGTRAEVVSEAAKNFRELFSEELNSMASRQR